MTHRSVLSRLRDLAVAGVLFAGAGAVVVYLPGDMALYATPIAAAGAVFMVMAVSE